MKERFCDEKLKVAAVYVSGLYLDRYFCRMSMADLQSVLYLAQERYTERTGRLMFCEGFEAGRYGVSNDAVIGLYPCLMRLPREYGSLLTRQEKETPDTVFARYAPFRPGVLDKAVRDSAPYAKARSTVPAGSPKRVPVCCDDM